MNCINCILRFSLLLIILPTKSWSQSADELAKQLANPVASLISVPMQLNYDSGGGIEDDGSKFLLNIQPVVPLSISDSWNLISRTIIPIVSQQDYVDDGSLSQSGLGDIVQSVFFSPKEPTANGLIWGVGPAFLVPTASEEVLGADQWAAGPTAVVLMQKGKLTYGALTNHLESVSSDESKPDISATFLQPFINYSVGGGLSYAINIEATYDWENEQETVPLNLMVTKVSKWGNQMVSYGGGVRSYISAPEGAPDWGLRFVFTLLYPK